MNKSYFKSHYQYVKITKLTEISHRMSSVLTFNMFLLTRFLNGSFIDLSH